MKTIRWVTPQHGSRLRTPKMILCKELSLEERTRESISGIKSRSEGKTVASLPGPLCVLWETIPCKSREESRKSVVLNTIAKTLSSKDVTCAVSVPNDPAFSPAVEVREG
jgi:hypothetical protein